MDRPFVAYVTLLLMLALPVMAFVTGDHRYGTTACVTFWVALIVGMIFERVDKDGVRNEK